MKEKIIRILENSYTTQGEFDKYKAAKELLDLYLVSKRGDLDVDISTLLVKRVEPVEQCNKSKWGDCECEKECRRGLKL